MLLKNVSYSNDIYLAALLSIAASLSSRNHYVATTFSFTGHHFNERKSAVTKSTSYFMSLEFKCLLRGWLNLDGDGSKTAIAKTTSELQLRGPSKENEWEKRCYVSQKQIILFLQGSDSQDPL